MIIKMMYDAHKKISITWQNNSRLKEWKGLVTAETEFKWFLFKERYRMNFLPRTIHSLGNKHQLIPLPVYRRRDHSIIPWFILYIFVKTTILCIPIQDHSSNSRRRRHWYLLNWIVVSIHSLIHSLVLLLYKNTLPKQQPDKQHYVKNCTTHKWVGSISVFLEMSITVLVANS